MGAREDLVAERRVLGLRVDEEERERKADGRFTGLQVKERRGSDERADVDIGTVLLKKLDCVHIVHHGSPMQRGSAKNVPLIWIKTICN